MNNQIKGNDEVHDNLIPNQGLKQIPMGSHINFDEAKLQKIVDVKVNFLNGNWTLEEAKRELTVHYERVTAQEFAICEQYLQEYGISDDLLAERMEEILEIFEGVLETNAPTLSQGHPIQTYMNEIAALRKLLNKMREQLSKKFIFNEWAVLYDQLAELQVHFSRKQNQLFPALERKGFDKPSKVMWTLDNQIRNAIKEAQAKLHQQDETAFKALQLPLFKLIEDMMMKESEILFPTALELLSDEEFILMRQGDDEIGYCLIENPGPFGRVEKTGNVVKSASEELNHDSDAGESNLMSDLTQLIQKYGLASTTSTHASEELNVSQGKLKLEQINLIFKHLPIDLSYVDEHDIVKFYSDTKHRVFPRSPGVIGREVRNCHPRESVATVEEIIRAFKAGEQDQAEFWLEIGDKFIYIVYNAVRDEQGQFKGILEMMQDVTKIRSLKGSQRLLSWNNPEEKSQQTPQQKLVEEAKPVHLLEISPDTVLGPVVKKYPFLKDFLINLSPKFSKLSNPVLFKTMSSMATFQMISDRGGFDVEDLMAQVKKEIESQTK